jgi:hypothetical protein
MDKLAQIRERREAIAEARCKAPMRAKPKPVAIAKPLPVTKPPVTKPRQGRVTKPNKGGRPCLGDKPMTAAERARRYRAARRAG